MSPGLVSLNPSKEETIWPNFWDGSFDWKLFCPIRKTMDFFPNFSWSNPCLWTIFKRPIYDQLERQAPKCVPKVAFLDILEYYNYFCLKYSRKYAKKLYQTLRNVKAQKLHSKFQLRTYTNNRDVTSQSDRIPNGIHISASIVDI